MKKLIYLLMLLFLFACEKEGSELKSLGEHAGIIGTWVEEIDASLPISNEGITRMSRSKELDPDLYGFILHDDGSFTEHKNAGWCGTPPIVYDTYEGTWEALSDSLLNITVAYWGGILTYQMQIIFLDEDELGIRYLFSEDRIEAR